MNNNEGLKIIKAEIENFKNIAGKTIEFDGKSFVFLGRNGAGKSSLIQALESPLDAKKIPSKPIKEGQERSTISLTVAGTLHGEPKEYTLNLYFTPANQKGKLVVTNAEGGKVDKSVVKSIIGKISFDIFEFLDAKKDKQIADLKVLSKVADKIDKIDMERKKVYDERTYLNQRVGELEAVVGNHGYSQEEVELYSTTIDLSPLNEELKSVSNKIATWSRIKNGVIEKANEVLRARKEIGEQELRIERLQQEIEAAKKKIADLQEGAEKLNADVANGEAWLKKTQEPSAKAITDKITAASEHNSHHAKISAYGEKQKELIKLKEKARHHSETLKVYDEQKAKVIENSKLPVKGLTFTDEEIFFNGLPFGEDNIPKSKIIEIGARIAMAFNPNLRVIFIKDGALLDKDTMKAVVELADKEGYQVLIEFVDFNASKELEIKYIEDFLNNV